MAKTGFKTLAAPTLAKWSKWLQANHATAAEIWLIFHKRHTGQPSISYEDAVDEALCYGWVDSLVKRLDDKRYARKFTPRKADSRWSTINRRRYAKLKAAGRLKSAGLARPPTARSGDAPRPSVARLPAHFAAQLRASPRAWNFFQQLAPSHQQNYLAWIDSAKREETRQKRLREAITLLESGQKLGLK